MDMIKPENYNIGLSIGTRSIGIAIIRHKQLYSYKVWVFKNAWSKLKLKIILGRLQQILKLPACMIAIKTPSPSYRSPQFKQLLKALLISLKNQNIKYELLTIDDLKAHCFPGMKTNKRAMVACIARKYPQLYRRFERESKNRHPHYTKLFEATVAAEIICLENTQ
jgi:hypothetical protein